MLSGACIHLLDVLLDTVQAYQTKKRDELTIDLVELNCALGSQTKAPFHDKTSTIEALEWCKMQKAPLLPLILVMDKNYRIPESSLLTHAFGSQPRAAALEGWHAQLERIKNLSHADIATLRAYLTELKEQAPQNTTTQSASQKTHGSPLSSPRAASSPRTAGGMSLEQTTSTSPSSISTNDQFGSKLSSSRTQGASRTSAKQQSARSATTKPRSARAHVRVQQIDGALFSQWYERFVTLIEEMTSADDLFDNDFLESEEGYKQRAWDRWHEQLNSMSWNEQMAGTGQIVRAIQSTLNDADADWIGPADEPMDLALKLRRRAHAAGVAQFETALMQFYADELSVKEFLVAMKDLLGRQYALISHFLFLKDKTTYVPVEPSTLEAGLENLGVVLSLSGYCTWESYSRLLSYLDRIRHLFAEREVSASRLDAHSFLKLVGSGAWFDAVAEDAHQ